MSIAAIEAAGSPSGGAQSAVARIAELQSLIAQAHGAPAPSAAAPAATGGASFGAALASANQAGAYGAQQAALGTPGVAGYGATAAPGTDGTAFGAGAGAGVGGEPTPYDGLIVAAAQRHGIDPALLKGLIRAESNFDPSVTSGAGAGGLVQLMPGTAASLGVTDRFDPAQSIDGGARYLRQQLDAFGGDVTKALAAYNAGPGAVQRYDGVPPYAETQAYVQKVQGYAGEYRVAPTATTPAPPPYAAAAPTSLPPTTGSGSIT
jgi:soluble lytic murein transglycosylase-like protein